jgi:glutathione S-transferase
MFALREWHSRKKVFRRVPTLEHDGFILYETTAITRYVDEAFAGPSLQPTEPRKRARMAQIIAIADSYGYWPMVRQVFSQRVFGPRLGRPVDEREIVVGLEAASRVLGAIEALVEQDDFLVGETPFLADLHLAPMVAYFTAATEGKAVLDRYLKLSRWWSVMGARRSLVESDPGLPPEQKTSFGCAAAT